MKQDRVLHSLSMRFYRCPSSGYRDVVGIAKTGSGKTAAFLIPAIVHVMDQRELEKGEGPIVVIVAPTHELAEQIYREACE